MEKSLSAKNKFVSNSRALVRQKPLKILYYIKTSLYRRNSRVFKIMSIYPPSKIKKIGYADNIERNEKLMS